MAVHGHRRWQPLVAIGALDGLADAQIVHRENVEPAEGKYEKHFRAPAPNAFHMSQLVYHFGIAVPGECSELQGTVLDSGCQIFQIGNFLAGQANAPVNQEINTNSRTDSVGTSVSYLEPLSKLSFWN